MVTTNVDGGGNFFVTAKDPAGPWSEPVWIRDFPGIDPSLFFDDDGKVYLTGPAGGGGKPRGIYQSEIDVKTGRLAHARRGSCGTAPARATPRGRTSTGSAAATT